MSGSSPSVPAGYVVVASLDSKVCEVSDNFGWEDREKLRDYLVESLSPQQHKSLTESKEVGGTSLRIKLILPYGTLYAHIWVDNTADQAITVSLPAGSRESRPAVIQLSGVLSGALRKHELAKRGVRV